MEETPSGQEDGLFKIAWKWVLKHPAITFLVVFLFLLFIQIVVWAIWSDISPEWTGFGEYEPPISTTERFIRHKTLWDWMELLIVPLALAIGAFWFNFSQKKIEQKRADEQRQKDLEIAQERQQQNTLERYFDRMTELLLDRGLGPGAEPEVIRLARNWTMIALGGLDGDKNQQIVRFLQESDLIGHVLMIDLKGADLSEAKLSKAKLNDANLRDVDFSRADLSMADLSRVDLRDSDLSGSDLSEAKLNEADLSGTDLSNAKLGKASLNEAKLTGADLSNSQLWEADLWGANLNRADLSGADMWGARLWRAILNNANLNGTILSHADLSYVDLRGALNLTDAQLLDSVRLEGATMPDGRSYEEWVKDRKHLMQLPDEMINPLIGENGEEE